MNNRDWMDQAECVDMDVELFFPSENTSAKAESLSGKSVCGYCNVREACLEYALATRQREGIWGGITSRERRRLLALSEPGAPA